MTDAEETKDEKENRELIELLNELRVVLPGVQVLFAFLLSIPFTGKFATVDDIARATYLIAFFTTATSAVLLMAPTTFHRIRFRQGDKEALLQMANRFTLAGIVSLSVAIVSVIWLVSELVLSQTAATGIGILAAVAIIGLWFAIPLWRRARDDD